MASCYKFPKSEFSKSNFSPVLSCDINFEGRISSQTCARLILEIIKYLMYHKEQIPVPFDQLQDLFKTRIEEKSISKLHQERKISAAIRTINELFFNIEHSFSNNIHLEEIAIVLGATIVSPQFVYIIRMPKISHLSSEPHLSFRKCMSTLFHTIITSQVLQDSNSITITNIIFLVKAHRDSGLSWFVPKPSFTFVNRGHKVVINLNNELKILTDLSLCAFQKSSKAETLLSNSCELNISNSKSICDIQDCVGMNIVNKFENLKISDDKENDQKLHQVCHDNGFIWFQAPTIFKGFRDTWTKKSSNDDIWM